MAPEPGRLVSLGSERDRADATAILGVVASWGSRPRTLVRSALTEGWERLRLPRPLVLRGVKLPASWPWSPAARAEAERAASEGRPDRPRSLVQEHVQPIGEIVDALVTRTDLTDPTRLIAFLSDTLTYAVITKAEDQQISDAGFARNRPDGDAWARYRAAGLDVDTFAPLSSELVRPGRRRNLRSMQFFVNGRPQPPGRETLGWVAQHPARMSVAALRELIRRENRIDDPDNESWTLTLPSGHVIEARPMP